MEPNLLDTKAIDPPPRGLIQQFLSLDPPGRFRTSELSDVFDSDAKRRKFAHDAARRLLSVRIRHGEYVAVDPSVAVRTWALPDYWAGLLALHDIVDQLGIDYAFACLTAGRETDLVPGRPWLVVQPPEDREEIDAVDRFVYAFREEEVGTEPTTVMDHTFDLPRLSREETALLLASTGLGRQVDAARSILEAYPPDEQLVPFFNHVGIDTGSENLESEDPGIRFPSFIEEERERLSDELLRGGIG